MTQTDAIRAFDTFSHYLTAARNFITATYTGQRNARLRRMLQAQAGMRGYGRLAPLPNVDLAAIQRVLNNAWQNELALNVPRVMDDEAAFRFSIQWSPVQAYYTMHSLWRAWASMNAGGFDDHRKARSTASSAIRTRSLFPAP